jgi:hypothetical protein
MNTTTLIIALLETAAQAVKASGASDTRVLAIAELVRRGMSLAGTVTTAGPHFVSAMQALTTQVKALHDAGVDDLTDAQQAALDAAVEKAHAEIQAG